jgi:site-specific recombinase XerC
MSNEILVMKEPRSLAGLAARPPALFLPSEKAAERFFGFFTANIRNKNTRRAYYKAACRFSDWCEGRGLGSLAEVKPLHVAAYVEALQGELAKPSVKQHLAALRMLFDWLVVGHVLDVNPAHAVRGPRYSQKKGKTPVLDRDEARALLAAIDNHSLRATGITDYLKSDGSLSEARKMANHADTRTTQLYDRRADAASLDEYNKVGI